MKDIIDETYFCIILNGDLHYAPLNKPIERKHNRVLITQYVNTYFGDEPFKWFQEDEPEGFAHRSLSDLKCDMNKTGDSSI